MNHYLKTLSMLLAVVGIFNSFQAKAESFVQCENLRDYFNKPYSVELSKTGTGWILEAIETKSQVSTGPIQIAHCEYTQQQEKLIERIHCYEIGTAVGGIYPKELHLRKGKDGILNVRIRYEETSGKSKFLSLQGGYSNCDVTEF